MMNTPEIAASHGNNDNSQHFIVSLCLVAFFCFLVSQMFHTVFLDQKTCIEFVYKGTAFALHGRK